MIEWIESLHWMWAISFFWAVGIMRTLAIYLLGWLAASEGTRFARIQRAMNTPVYLKAQAFINRWGVLAVPLCFLTLGFQTAVIITTGFTRMPLLRWIPAMLVGTFIWACIYGTLGMAVVQAWLLRPTIIAPMIVLLVLTVGLAHLYRRKKMR